MREEENARLMMELNRLRATKKKIGDFKSVSEWQEHCRKIDEAKARIIQQIENNCKPRGRK